MDDSTHRRKDAANDGPPIKVVSERIAYENPWIQVLEYRTLNRASAPGLYGIMKCRYHGVAVAPYEDGGLWMVSQYRLSVGAMMLEIPKGGSPPPETTMETARRELREETGFDAREFVELGTLHLADSLTDEHATLFLARGLTPGPPSPDEDEELRLVRIPLDEAYEAANSGKITDAVSVCAILRLMLMRAEGRL